MDEILKRVVLAQVIEDEIVVKYLNTADKELENIQKNIKFPSNDKLKEISDLGTFDNPKSFSIEKLTTGSPYYKLVDFFDIDYSKPERRLKSIDDIDFSNSQNGFKPNLVLYYYLENEEEIILIAPLNINKLLVKDKLFLGLKKHVGVNNGIDMITHEIKDSIELPMSSFICMISKKNDTTFSINVYDTFRVDKQFQLYTHINAYAEKVLKRFNSSDQNKFLLTTDKIEVQIDNIDSIMNVVTDNEALSKSLSFYSGHGNKMINQITGEKLLLAINNLKDHAKDENNKITVSGNQIRIFVALLNNQIVEKILNNQIDLPYF